MTVPVEKLPKPSQKMRFFATTAKAMEELLVGELESFGATNVQATRAGASFEGDLEVAYRACLHSRVANRILLPLRSFAAPTPEKLYGGVKAIRWMDHLEPEGTLAVDFSSSRSEITHTHFGALKVKDAIVDQMRSNYGVRPSVRIDRPDIRVNVYLHEDNAQVSLDLSGESLHLRGWREEGSKAPLKENLASAILMLADWPKIAAEGGGFVDPMCGSGTLPIEAAFQATGTPPGALRTYFGFLGWKQHSPEAWSKVKKAAMRGTEPGSAAAGLGTEPGLRAAGLGTEPGLRGAAGLGTEQLSRQGIETNAAGVRVRRRSKNGPIIGYDSDFRSVRVGLENIEQAGFRGRVHIEKRELALCERPDAEKGIIVVNPPYGERLGRGEEEELRALYGRIGDLFKQKFKGWTGYVITSNADLAKHIGLKATRRHVLYNGALECRLLRFDLY
jgi:23S rRNA (guanine2445-N2)-methyltransferase / 23S rRNA (guanine2069-N7)-methyltransferase